MASKFSSLGLGDGLVRQISAVGFKDPKPVQVQCIPAILEGRDCIGCAKTGSGKTAAFALPIIQKLSEDPYGIFALVISPTRELAYQIADQFRVFGQQLRLAVIIGGLDMMKQALLLAEKPHIVIATPGRLADHLQSTDTLSFRKLRFLVMDEADRLLDPSFAGDLEVIFSSLPPTRQTLLFSATMTRNLSRLKDLALKKPFFWEAPSEVATVEELEQKYILIPDKPSQLRAAYLVQLVEELHREEGKTMMIFTHTCRSCHVYAWLLQHLGVPCVALHSMMSQSQRLASLAHFKSGHFKSDPVHILVATDVASRGLDIPSVQAVVNINVPASATDYIHRVGRTARAGRGGLAVTLVTKWEIDRIKNIELHTNYTMGLYELKEAKALDQLNAVTKAKIEVNQKLRRSSFGEQRTINIKKRKLIEEVRKLKAKKLKGKRKPKPETND